MKRKAYVKQLKKLKVRSAETKDVDESKEKSGELGHTQVEAEQDFEDNSEVPRGKVNTTHALPNVHVLIKGTAVHAKMEEQVFSSASPIEADNSKLHSLASVSESDFSRFPPPKLNNNEFVDQDQYCYQEGSVVETLVPSNSSGYTPMTDILISGPESTCKDIHLQYNSVSQVVSDRHSFDHPSNFVGLTYTHLYPAGQTENSVNLSLPELERSKPPSDQTNLGQEVELPYHHDVETWEQENGRYVNYPWKYQGIYQQPTNGLVLHNAKNLNQNNVPIMRHGETLETSGLHRRDSPRRGRLNLSEVAPKTSGGRRRRKRLQTPVQRSAANMRERRRMCHLNVAFDMLKERLPNVKDKKKLSRIQTLKAAIYYIHLLRDSLNLS